MCYPSGSGAPDHRTVRTNRTHGRRVVQMASTVGCGPTDEGSSPSLLTTKVST